MTQQQQTFAVNPPTPEPQGQVIPISESTESAEQPSRQQELQNLAAERRARRDQMRVWGGMAITDISCVIGMRDRNGQRQEIIHAIDTEDEAVRIIQCTHDVKEEMTPVRVEGKVEGYEPTGKYRFKLDAIYVRN